MNDRKILEMWHEILLVIRKYNGETDFTKFEDLKQHQIDFLFENFNKIKENPDVSPEKEHQHWCNIKRSQGYKFGEIKDNDKKTHNCLVHYEDLNFYQKLKDYLFIQIIKFHSKNKKKEKNEEEKESNYYNLYP